MLHEQKGINWNDYPTVCKRGTACIKNRKIIEYLDEFVGILNDYQDNLAEVYQGITGQFAPNMLKGIPCDALNALDFINEVDIKTKEFYSTLPDDVNYVGIKSECETFINNIKKFIYLFKLTDIRPY